MNKKIIILLTGLFLLVIPLTSLVRAEQINNFTSQITVNKNGTVDVAESLDYDFGALQKHGIYRDIPDTKINQDGKKYRLSYRVISVIDDQNIPYNYTTSYLSSGLRIKIGDANRFVTGLKKYVIKYQVSGALTYFSDHDELYWNITGNDWQIPIESAQAVIHLPEEALGVNKIKMTCFTGIAGSTAKECSTKEENQLLVINTDQQINPTEGLTVAVSFPKNIVAVLEPKEVINFFDTLIGKIVLFIIILLVAGWYVIYPIWIVIQWYTNGRDPSASSGQVRAWFDAPKLKSGRVLTPLETGTIVDEKVDLKDFSGMIIHLAQRNYLKIVEKKKNDFYFAKGNKAYENDSSLMPFEKKLLQGIFTGRDEVRLKDVHLYETIADVKKAVNQDMTSEKLFDKNPDSIRLFYGVITGLAVFTSNILLAVTSFFFGRRMVKKTVEGVEAANVAKSLKNFLSSQERQLEFQAKNQMMFEKLLPFAVVFGVERIWADRFKDIALKPPNWYQGYDNNNFNSIFFVNRLNSSMNSFRSSATPPSSTRSSSGFSSGFSGGSSGGGGGGGGGGSW